MCPVFATTAALSALALQITAASTLGGLVAAAFVVPLALALVAFAVLEIRKWRQGYLAHKQDHEPTRPPL